MKVYNTLNNIGIHTDILDRGKGKALPFSRKPTNTKEMMKLESPFGNHNYSRQESTIDTKTGG